MKALSLAVKVYPIHVIQEIWNILKQRKPWRGWDVLNPLDELQGGRSRGGGGGVQCIWVPQGGRRGVGKTSASISY